MNRTKLVSLCLSLAVSATSLVARAQMSPGMGGGGMPGGGQGGPSKGPQADILPEIDERIATDPQKVFEHAEKAYNDRDWLEAIAYFQHLRTKFSYNSLATISELRLADIAFKRERWPEAKSYYRNFLRLHPKHEKADYAAYQLGMCAFRDIPTDFFIEPPSYERDQTEVHVALDLMRDFVRNYPASSYVPEAKSIVVQCEDKLAAHEIYVAQFYAKREKWAGAVLRAEGLAKTFPTSNLVPVALVLAVKAHTKLNQPEAAKKNLEDLVSMQAPQQFIHQAQALLNGAQAKR